MQVIKMTYNNEKGFVLPVGLMFLAIIAILGTTAVIITTTDLKIGSNYKQSVQAFYDADAGIQYVIGSVEDGLGDGTFALPATIGDSVPFSSAAPTGFSFVISDISMTGSNAYAFTSAVSGAEGSQAVIEASFKRKSAINYAAFGDQKTDTKNSGITLSYDSSDPGAPSTHEADVASNDWLVTHNGAVIDGSGVFGEQSDGSPTVDGIHGGTVFNGTPSVINAGRIDPDPLGLNSGGVYDPSIYSTSNDNNFSPDVAGTTIINASGSITMYGKSGGANYYFTDIKLKNGANLTIDASAGPVNIFLEGGLDTHNNAIINVIDSGNPGEPTDFAIFSNSTAKIDFKHNSEFKGLVYAPFADVDMKNSSSVYGAIWAKTVDIKNSGTLYYDTALKDKYPTNDLSLLSWREVL